MSVLDNLSGFIIACLPLHPLLPRAKKPRYRPSLFGKIASFVARASSLLKEENGSFAPLSRPQDSRIGLFQWLINSPSFASKIPWELLTYQRTLLAQQDFQQILSVNALSRHLHMYLKSIEMTLWKFLPAASLNVVKIEQDRVVDKSCYLLLQQMGTIKGINIILTFTSNRFFFRMVFMSTFWGQDSAGQKCATIIIAKLHFSNATFTISRFSGVTSFSPTKHCAIEKSVFERPKNCQKCFMEHLID